MRLRYANELGLDMSNQYSKHVDTLKDIKFDVVLTVCDHAMMGHVTVLLD